MSLPAHDYRDCVIAVAESFGKQSVVQEFLPDGQIDEFLFRYIVEKCGLAAEQANKPPPIELTVPYVVVTKDGNPHLVAFPREGMVQVIDADGCRDFPIDRFQPIENAIKYYLLSFRAGSRPEMNMFSRFAWFWQPVATNSWAYFQVVLATMMTNFMSLSMSIFMMVVYDRILPSKSYDSLVALTIGVVISMTLEFTIRHIRGYYTEVAGQQVDLAIGRQMFDKIFEAKLEAMSGGVGAISNVFMQAELLREFFTSVSLMTFIDLPFSLIFIVVIFVMSGPLVIIPLLVIPMLLAVCYFIQPFMVQKAADSVAKSRLKQNAIVETLSGIETLRTMTAANTMRRRWMEGIVQQAATERSSRLLANAATNITQTTQQIAQVAVMVLGVFLMDDNTITMGGLVAATMLTARVVAPLAQVTQMLIRMNHAKIAFNSIDKLLKAPTLRDPTTNYIRRERLSGKIEFRNVSFFYPGQKAPALNNVSFTIGAGEKVAIVGKVGTGKSTIAKLILGLYQPNHGAILFDDMDSRQIDPLNMQNNTSSLLQEVWTFSGTIRENIAIGRPGATDDQIIEASQIATAHDFIASNPLGYDLQLAERGQNLSGGQRQAIGMARAMIRDAPIMVFDEPTASMDANTESALIQRMKVATADKTVVIITHRTSILDLVERVIVIDKGMVIGDGPKSILGVTNQPVPA